ncbi:amiloride-sensitive amine oxidase [copper-containing]-like [Grammomys surdaster]|uniref:amiloride-sensitive amine oxidase [copper-containing]-like n=1 Tax=Grammomys surdaster TaxID=491861 RepID=UPI00109EFA4B|nr:amiloride-sensitive amine oxidase [copper-containing]-like [Grammomys surdaster]
MNLVGRILALGWMTTVLVVQMSVAKHSRWSLNTKRRVLWDLSATELERVHDFLMSRKELELQPSTVLTLAKNSVFLIEMLMPKKYEVLAFLDKGAMPPLREARVLIYFGAQEYPNVTEYAVGPIEQPMYMRKLNRKGGQELSWASRPMSKVESALLFYTLKTATKPLQEFFFDTTGFTLQDCNGGCLTFTNVGPRAMTFGKRHSWFLLQRFLNGHDLQPTGLEILLDHGSTDVQNWRVEQLWYNGQFYNSPEELAWKYAEGEVDTVVLEDPLPKTTEESPQFSTYKPHAEFLAPISKGGPQMAQSHAEFPMPISKGGPQMAQLRNEFPTPISKGGHLMAQLRDEFPMPISKGGPQMAQSRAEFPTPISKGGHRMAQLRDEFPRPISKGGPRVVQPYPEFPMPISKGGFQGVQPTVPHYRLNHNTVLYGDWSFFFKLHSSYGLQLFNVHFRGERIAYEVGVQEVMALYKGHKAAGRETKYMDVGWGLAGITHQLTPGIDCPHQATFLDAIHYYDSDGPVLSQRALCIFELPMGAPLRQDFSSNFRNSFSSYARLSGPVLVLRTASTIHNHDYIWDFIFHSSGMMEGKMYATGYVHATFFTSEGLLYRRRLHTHLRGNVHSHLAHYRLDLDVAGTKNSFQTLKMRLENTINPWSHRSRQVKPILDKTQYSWERQAAFHFRQTLPKYLLFSNTGKSVSGHSRSYRLHIPSVAEQMLPPGWQYSPAFTWPRYQLAVTKYQESERFHSTLYNQNHHWAYPMVFENFIHNNENIEDEDLVAWVTVGLSHNHHSENGPSMATPGNSAGFLLQPFDLYNSFQRYTASPIHAQCVC